jgi:hypothetical protein
MGGRTRAHRDRGVSIASTRLRPPCSSRIGRRCVVLQRSVVPGSAVLQGSVPARHLRRRVPRSVHHLAQSFCALRPGLDRRRANATQSDLEAILPLLYLTAGRPSEAAEFIKRSEVRLAEMGLTPHAESVDQLVARCVRKELH